MYTKYFLESLKEKNYVNNNDQIQIFQFKTYFKILKLHAMKIEMYDVFFQ